MIPALPGGWLQQPQLYQRADEADDAQFYAQPRLVQHIDVLTIDALTAFYRTFIPEGARILDLMSSWVSHLPDDVDYPAVTGLGMNAEELAANPRLHDWLVHDLNQQPQLPWPAQSFDVVLCCVSVQYLTQPVAVFRSAQQCLAPGGRICIATSHRCFPTKAIAAFAHLPPEQRIAMIGGYLTEAGFHSVAFEDRSPPGADPLWLVTGTAPA